MPPKPKKVEVTEDVAKATEAARAAAARLAPATLLAANAARSSATKLKPVFGKAAKYVYSLNWKVILLNLLTIPPVGTIYWDVNTQGFASQFTILAKPLHRIPAFSWMKNYEGLHLITMAHVMSMAILAATWLSWILLAKFAFYGDQETDQQLNRKSYYTFLITICSTVILADAFIFFSGLTEELQGWTSEDPDQFVPAIATLLYVALLAGIALLHVRLARTYQLNRTPLLSESKGKS